MREEVKQAWIEALESGKYRKNVGSLRRTGAQGECFCALGVLCDISGLGVWGEPDEEGETGYEVMGEVDWIGVPQAVREWAGTSVRMPFAGVGDRRATVSGLNDNGASFAEIAAMLRATPAEEL